MTALLRQFVSVAALTLIASLAAAQAQDAVLQEITLRGTVEAIDHPARTVRIRGVQGNVVTLDVPATATRFDQVKIGDSVTIAYYDRVSIRPKPPGEVAVDRMTDTTTEPMPGLLPGGTRAIQRVTTATIDAWDPAARIVTFTTPSGQYIRRVSALVDASVIGGLKVGDRVDVIRTEAVRFNVERAAPAPQVTVAATPAEFRHRFTVSFLWGPDNSFSGKMIKAASGTFQNIPLNFNETSYDDVYGRINLFKIGVGYRTNPRVETTVHLVFSGSSSEQIRIGSVGAANAPLFATFDDYSYWGIEGGQRFYFARVRFTPFVGYFVGINRIDTINGTFSAASVGSQPALLVENGQFFDKSWALSLGPTGGVLIGLGPIEVMGELEVRYMGGLSDVDPLSQAGLSQINSDSSRWSLPILIGARYRF
jgi:hypothetical protein